MNNPYDPIINGHQSENDASSVSQENRESNPSNDYSNRSQSTASYGYFNNSYQSGEGTQQSHQSNQYQYYSQGQQSPKYNTSYYGAGYYPPSSPYSSYHAPRVKEKKQPKPASRGFVITAVTISIIISFFLGIITSAIITTAFPFATYEYSKIGDQVIVQYAPKGEEEPVVTDKGIPAYVASLVSNTVVEVRTETVATDSYFGQYITQGAGSGVIVSSTDDGSHIITCAHVIDGATKVTVKLKDGTTYEAESFVYDTESDVGIIKLNVKGLPTATLGNFDEVAVGEEVVAIGNPLGTLGGSVTNGIVSALDRDIIIDGTTYHLLQTNAEINPGNSGGGLFNAQGHLIGIVNAKSSGDNIEGLGFAIPINEAQTIMSDLLEKGYVSGRVKLGFNLFEIQTQDDIRTYFKYSRYFTDYGVYIAASEDPNFREGDLIVSINDGVENNKIATISDLKAILQKLEVGQTVSVTVSRVLGSKVQLFTYDLVLQEKKP